MFVLQGWLFETWSRIIMIIATEQTASTMRKWIVLFSSLSDILKLVEEQLMFRLLLCLLGMKTQRIFKSDKTNYCSNEIQQMIATDKKLVE